jgi:hypothetical protein
MAAFKKTIATAKAKVADAETQAFMARLEAIDAILEGPHRTMSHRCARMPSRKPGRSVARRKQLNQQR